MTALVARVLDAARRYVLDQYTGVLGHKPDHDHAGGAMVTPWTGWEHHRRLQAYRVLEAMFRNRGREFSSLAEPERHKVREYGDYALLVHVVVAAVLGDSVAIEVPVDTESPDPAALARQAELDEWATAEALDAKLLEMERDAVRVGDSVAALTVSGEKGRVRLRPFGPESYFPVRDPNAAEDDFPATVRIAWQYEERVNGEVVERVRAMTWRLVTRAAGPRRLPWSDRPTATTCLFSDGTWSLASIVRSGRTIDDGFLDGDATWATVTSADGTTVELRDFDLDLDFVPVLHVPNTVAIKSGWGEALASPVVQLLEDLARADTNAVDAADLAAVPMVGYSGSARAGDIVVSAGTAIDLGTDGQLSTIDLSAALAAVVSYRDGLRDRLSSNIRLPAEVLGLVKAGDIASGVLLAMSFGPMRSLVEEMRLVRRHKYSLLLKMVQRMSVRAGFWSGDIIPAGVAFGSYLPSDSAAALNAVLDLWKAHLISRRTAIERLVAEGIVDVDVAAELEACEAEDFGAALALLNATDGADLGAVYELLHRPKPEAVVDPALAPRLGIPAPGTAPSEG